MTTDAQGPPFYWEARLRGDDGRFDRPPGQDLAAMRRGLGREPGSIPEMWRFYTTLTPSGGVTDRLHAEHLTLGLYATHQQSQGSSMHRRNSGLGRGLTALRSGGRFSEDAVDQRFAAAATADGVDELAYHLRGLVSRLTSHSPAIPLDYTELYWQLLGWHDPARRGAIRRRWGADYFTPRPSPPQANP